jgi:hypothetical protein
MMACAEVILQSSPFWTVGVAGRHDWSQLCPWTLMLVNVGYDNVQLFVHSGPMISPETVDAPRLSERSSHPQPREV